MTVEEFNEAITRRYNEVGATPLEGWSSRNPLGSRELMLEGMQDIDPDEDTPTIAVLDAVNERVSPVISDVIGANISLPTIASLPINDPNACTIRVPGSGDTIVAFNLGLPEYINRMAKIFGEVMILSAPTTAEEISSSDWPQLLANRIATIIDQNPDLTQRFFDTVFSFSLGRARSVQRHVPSNFAVDAYRTFLVRGAEAFVVGHEYGHIIGRHTAETSTATRHSLGDEGDVNAEILVRSQMQELEADHYGMKICLAAANRDWSEQHKNDLLWTVETAGPIFFLLVASILQSARRLLPNPPSAVDTHPPNKDRIALIAHQFMVSLDMGPNRVANDLAIAYVVLWAHYKKQLAEILGRSHSPG
jgi:hypothetical protein